MLHHSHAARDPGHEARLARDGVPRGRAIHQRDRRGVEARRGVVAREPGPGRAVDLLPALQQLQLRCEHRRHPQHVQLLVPDSGHGLRAVDYDHHRRAADQQHEGEHGGTADDQRGGSEAGVQGVLQLRHELDRRGPRRVRQSDQLPQVRGELHQGNRKSQVPGSGKPGGLPVRHCQQGAGPLGELCEAVRAFGGYRGDVPEHRDFGRGH
mmetsp:Transcript_16720/g.41371  ORF Transcript_16720/g.41371 Transcript_16720/m.41371 type:complete len:210 (-) Transcript_16720:545-1174(-)